ncbi:MAG: hypothetical protein R3C25_02995 [Hyphomonadaceae bacterium]
MNQTANLMYLVVALVIVAGAVAAARQRAKSDNARGPGIATSLLIWLALIGAAYVLYRGGEI